MGYSEKISRKNRERIQSKPTHKEQVKESFKVAKEITTDVIDQAIKNDYEAIDKALSSLDKTSKDYPVFVQQLKMLKTEIPKRYAISKEYISHIQDEINIILGQNTSNTV